MKKLVLILLVSFFLLVSCSFLPDQSGQKVSILSVGLDYKDSSVSSLKGTVNDAKEVGMALKLLYDQRGIECSLEYMIQEDHTVSYYDPQYPNDVNVLNKIKNQSLDEDDLFIFYYAGHGETEEGGKMFLATGSTSTSYSKLYFSNILNALDSLPCRSVVILDSCHSGMMDPQNQLYPNDILSSISEIFGYSWYDRNRITVLASASAREKAADGTMIRFQNGSEEYHGRFTTRLLAQLGWNHATTGYEYTNKDGRKIIINGRSEGVSGFRTMDEIYNSMMKDWSEKDQSPVLFDTIESIVLIPAR